MKEPINQITDELLIEYAKGRLDDNQNKKIGDLLNHSNELSERLEAIESTMGFIDQSVQLINKSLEEDEIGWKRFKNSYEDIRSTGASERSLSKKQNFLGQLKQLIKPEPMIGQFAMACIILFFGFGIGRITYNSPNFDPSSVGNFTNPQSNLVSLNSKQDNADERITYSLSDEKGIFTANVSEADNNSFLNPEILKETIVKILNDRNALALIITDQIMYEVDIRGRYDSGEGNACEVGEVKTRGNSVTTFIACKNDINEWEINFVEK